MSYDNMPYIDTVAIRDVLRLEFPLTSDVPIFDEFPSDEEIVRYGLYVSAVYTTSRTPYQLGVHNGGSIYTALDQFNVVFVSFQTDPKKERVNAAIAGLVTYKLPTTDIAFLDGYFERDFVQNLEYKTQLEKYNYTFQLKRLEFQ